MRHKLALILIVSIVASVFIGALGSAFATVSSMQSANFVEDITTVTGRTSEPIPVPTAPTPTPSATPSSAGTATNPVTNDFTVMLASLATDDAPASHTGYNRDLFKAWIDADSDGCDTRAEVLLVESLIKATTRNTCTVSTGSWVSLYDGATFTDASKLDIDHFVPLAEAWVSGAYAWPNDKKVRYGNDLGYASSLIAVSASSNRSKSDSDPAKWMPSNKSYYCDYVATWVAVKWRWSLTVDTLERRAIQAVLTGCASVSVPLPQKAG